MSDETADRANREDDGAAGVGGTGGTPGERTDSEADGRFGVGRRRLLALTGAAGVGGLAGCGGGDGGDGGTTANPTTSDAGTTPTTAPPATSTPSATATTTEAPSTTAEPTSTPAPELTDPRQVLTAPGAHNHPLDGYANADWLVEDKEEIQVIPVTNLNASGEGSLRSAMRTTGPRIIVFEVGGVIDLEGDTLQVDPVETSIGGWDYSRMYIAGQTAPDPGITVIRGSLAPYARNCIIQHIRVRVGDQVDDAYDSISIGSLAANCIVDHCSTTWSIDENLSADGGQDIPGRTLSNNIIAEGLYDSVHPKGPHSMGTLLEENQRDISVIGNLYSCNDQRHPRMKGGVHGLVVNNFAYNFGYAIAMGGEGESPATATVESNHWRAGPALWSEDRAIVASDKSGPYKPQAYVADNLREPDTMPVITTNYMNELTERPYWTDALSPVPSEEVAATVFSAAGARPARRTFHDQRVVDEARNEEGTLIDSQSAVGGYPDLEATERPLDPPAYGPEFAAWLRQHTRAVELGEAPPSAG
ncbi:MAG: pectate lyase [Halobacteriaceae archaeon]